MITLYISATHAAMSSTRVMGTCSLLGQAMGTAVSVCFKNNLKPSELKDEYIKELQKEIMNDGIFLPYTIREINEVSKSAEMNISDEQREILFSGIERPRSDGDMGNKIQLEKGENLSFSFDDKKHIDTLRIQFDMDFARTSVTPNWKMRVFAQKFGVTDSVLFNYGLASKRWVISVFTYNMLAVEPKVNLIKKVTTTQIEKTEKLL